MDIWKNKEEKYGAFSSAKYEDGSYFVKVEKNGIIHEGSFKASYPPRCGPDVYDCDLMEKMCDALVESFGIYKLVL